MSRGKTRRNLEKRRFGLKNSVDPTAPERYNLRQCMQNNIGEPDYERNLWSVIMGVSTPLDILTSGALTAAFGLSINSLIAIRRHTELKEWWDVFVAGSEGVHGSLLPEGRQLFSSRMRVDGALTSGATRHSSVGGETKPNK